MIFYIIYEKKFFNMNNYKAPEYRSKAFNCPYCEAYSNMIWYDLSYADGYYYDFPFAHSGICKCSCCNEYMIWVNGEMVIPSNSPVPMPHVDMPEDIKKVYMEARDIINKSPKGASALLRLALQMLCDYLVSGNKNINDKISELVKNGLPITLQKAFDLVRIIGNNAVHPGVINLDDNPEMANKLFELLNMIVEYMIAQPQKISNFYDNTIPENQKRTIAKRDAN